MKKNKSNLLLKACWIEDVWRVKTYYNPLFKVKKKVMLSQSINSSVFINTTKTLKHLHSHPQRNFP